MIWNNVELFNVSEVETREDGALRIFRFPKAVREAFYDERNTYMSTVGNMTTGCEIRFVGEEADVIVSADDADGTVEIYRGDFLCRTERLAVGERRCIELRRPTALDSYDISGYRGAFSPDVWRVIFDHDFCGTINGVNSTKPVRPPKACEIPSKKIIAYGSSITHSAQAGFYTNSYIATVGKILGADVLCKGMGGSCQCQPEVADYIASEQWDTAILELGINMISGFHVSVFKERATYVVKRALERGKPVVMISNFTSYNDLPGAKYAKENDDYVKCYEGIYNELKCDNLYYIRGRDIVTDLGYLTADLIHPSPYGHGEMGRKIASKLRDEFKII